jgi:hypothetical protein
MSQTRAQESSGFTLLDGAALVLGAAVASVHLRRTSGEALDSGVIVLFWATFTGVATTASGPFLFLVRRFGRRREWYPTEWDRLWAVLGLPWVFTSLIRASALPTARQAGRAGRADLYAPSLILGLAVAVLVVLVHVWVHWIARPPGARPDEPLPWTARVGLVLSVAWPLQCGFGLLVTAP